MKNVAIIVQHLSGGGAERMAANMSIELSEKYNVYMIVFDTEKIAYGYGGTLVDLDIPPIRVGSSFKRAFNMIKRIKALRKFKKEHNIHCSISHMEGANIVNILSRRKDKIISVLHHMPSTKAKNPLYVLVQRVIGRWSDKYITVSKLAEQSLIKDIGVPKKKVECIYNFCNTENVEQNALKGIEIDSAKDFYKNHKQIVISMGRLNPIKNQASFLKAFSEVRNKCPESGLVLLGEGEERANLEGIAKRLGIEDDVYMPGNVENPFPYVKSADAFVLSSNNEALPMVLIEAMACGCPVVSTDMPSGAREILAPDTDMNYTATEKEYGKYGLLVPVCTDGGKEKILADAICEMFSDEKLQRNYIEKSTECAKSFSPDVILAIWDELIEK